jgi:glycerophosphoryl diester phosphodiesterase
MVLNSLLHRQIACTLLSLLLCLFAASAPAGEKIVIATNGAGEQFIEHTLPAVTLAATQDIDYIELHAVMTSDNQLIVFRDLTLNRLTDAADLFPDRSREDGNHYVIDFTLKEIQQMRLINVEADKPPLSLAIPTLKEELSLIRRLESILAKSIGITLEITHPGFHSEAGKDISPAILEILFDNGYIDNSSKLFIQCFDPEELQRIHAQLMPQKEMNIPLIQLIGHTDGSEMQQTTSEKGPYSYDWLYSNSGFKIVSSYAAAIGLPGDRIVDENGNLLLTDYIRTVHEYGLSVFVYSLSDQTENLPPFADTFSSLLDLYLQTAEMDGVYTDSFGAAKVALDRLEEDKKKKAELPAFFSSLNLSSPSGSGTTENSPENQENESL